jgi:hypothetical protein
MKKRNRHFANDRQ